jgi:hypothetical protein
MKIRNGFVSNSSSSSFVVAVKDEENATVKVTVEVNLKDHLNRPTISTVEELKNMYKKEYCVDIDADDNPFYQRQFLNAKAAIESGYIILFGEFNSYGGSAAETLLCEKGLPKDLDNIKVIYNEGGY